MIPSPPMLPVAPGRFTTPLMITVDPAATYAKPVITHLLVFWTMHPICPEAPASTIRPDPAETELAQWG